MTKKQKNKASGIEQTITGSESNIILAKYGVPVVKEHIVADAKEAVKKAENIGYPVVLKGFGKTLTHKTELGIVYLNLSTADSARQAAISIIKKSGNKLDGISVQPHIHGKREFVAGLFRDEQFGPVVMFGLGGIYTEALADVTFRLAPINKKDADEMINEIKAKKLLEDIRGEKPVNKKQLIQTLTGLSQIGINEPDIAEIDINPLLITPDGNILAVDTLIVKKDKTPRQHFIPTVKPESLGSLFYPKSIVFVGASANTGKWGYRLPANTISGKYKGKIFLVNPKGGRIFGRKAYKSVSEISEKVDLAVVTVPASRVMDLIPQLKARGIKNILLISSGFGETGKEGKRLEKELADSARKAGILILGPNTMGISNPHVHLNCTGIAIMPAPGDTAIVSQSGNMGLQLIAFAKQQRIGVRAFSGSGNEAMITIEDYIDAFEKDKLTRTVMLYVESVKNGRRFFDSAKRVGRKKPIVLLKGGQSEAGNIAAASHTGAMASNTKVFNAVCRQAGIVKVDRPMDMLDLAASFSSLPLPKGNRVAIMTYGGGWGVITADLCEQYGLNLPKLSSGIIKKINTILPSYWSKVNPIDLVGENDFDLPMAVIEELVKWNGCDAVINLGILGRRIMFKHIAKSFRMADPECSSEFASTVKTALKKFENQYIEHIITLMGKYDKPVFGVSILSDDNDHTVHAVKNNKYKAVFFPTPERAVKSLAKMCEYHYFVSRNHSI